MLAHLRRSFRRSVMRLQSLRSSKLVLTGNQNLGRPLEAVAEGMDVALRNIMVPGANLLLFSGL